ncbi:hypothetical protein F1737_00060 [Methanoplanus sp. FWC-SCC4]|uniref:Uncharacterized protein n=1 Tax=Methanochimaera problematica TaxID=2609417 RepID=A0AA97I306_9EURY|nr:hypothetical protein [Methanoplanus sp. FWC-SCC4]WOF15179.1 hypothetical protein F1737_00060 [Methanoplanus sp. FWC-SCC4]
MDMEITDKSKEQKVNELEKWCKETIHMFRKEYDSLDPLEQSCIQKSLSLLAPCQIEIFWVSNPTEFQLVVIFHDPERKDQEVIINGPYQGYELESEVIKIMDEPRWKRKARYKKSENDSFFIELDFDAGNQENKYSDLFVNPFYDLLNKLRNSSTIQYKKRPIQWINFWK